MRTEPSNKLWRLLLDNVIEGPGYVESILSKLTEEVDTVSAVSRYTRSISFLQAHRGPLGSKRLPTMAFLLGYLHEQTAAVTVGGERVEHLSMGLAYFQDFLSFGKAIPDMGYYAMWKSGRLQEALGVPWPIVLGTYQATLEIDPVRGEAVGDIMARYLAEKEWRIAYVFSSYAYRTWQHRLPSKDRRWAVDVPFYAWKILQAHIPVCLALRKKDEVALALETLTKYADQHREDLPEAVLQNIPYFEAHLLGKKGAPAPGEDVHSIVHLSKSAYEKVLPELHL